jgi:single-stranded DNA-specific DHH superfamily exonuclease
MITFENDDGTFSGSCRVPDRIEAFFNFRSQCVASGLFIYASGHEPAFGVKFHANKLHEIQNFFNEKFKTVDTSLTYNVDFMMEYNDPMLPLVIERLADYHDLWGQGIAEPLIAVTNVKIAPSNTQLMSAEKSPTIKIKLEGLELIKFKSSQEEFRSIIIPYDDGVEQCYNATVIGRASVNEWMGKITPQLQITTYDIDTVEYMF